MNKFYTKLNISFQDYDYSSFKGDLYHQYDGGVLAYYKIKNELQLRSMLPKVLNKISFFIIKLVEITGPTVIPPHKDYGLNASINFYFKPTIAETLWYDEKQQAKENLSHEEKTNIYKEKDLILVDRFIASVNDCFVFNNSQIHSVLQINNSVRQFLQFQYNIPYEQILEKLNDL